MSDEITGRVHGMMETFSVQVGTFLRSHIPQAQPAVVPQSDPNAMVANYEAQETFYGPRIAQHRRTDQNSFFWGVLRRVDLLFRLQPSLQLEDSRGQHDQ